MKLSMTSALFAVLLGGVAVAAPPGPAPEWMTHCGQNLASRHLAELAVRTYCTCMAGLGDDAEMLEWSQKDLERSFPYAHKRCVGQAAEAMDASH